MSEDVKGRPENEPAPPRRRLVSKLAEVMAAVGHVPKAGYNSHFKYKFVRESDLADAVRDELAKRQVVMFPRVVHEKVIREVEQRSGKAYLTRLTMDLVFIDGETGEEQVTRVVGDGIDHQDKGPYKATTGAIKYGIMKTFLIGTGDDPENSAGPAPGSAETDPDKVTSEQRAKLRALVKELEELSGEPVDAMPPATAKDAEELQAELEAAIKTFQGQVEEST